MNIKAISSIDTEVYRNFLSNYNHIKRNVGSYRLRNSIIKNMFQVNNSNNKVWESNPP